MQIDHCIVAWIYLTVSKTIRDMVFHRRATTFSAWNAVRGLFLNNTSQRVVYTLQGFHSLQQGDLSVHDYCCKLKQLADTLTDVNHPITDMDLVVNTMRGLNSKFSNALGVINAMNPLLGFLWVHSYLVPEETRLDRNQKIEAANSLLAVSATSSASSGAAAAALVATGSSTGTSKSSATQQGSSPTKGGSRQKKRKHTNGKARFNSGSTPGNPAPHQQQGASPYPWTDMVQAWQVLPPHWRPTSVAPFSNCPGTPPQAMYAQAPPVQQQQYSFDAPPNLFTTCHGRSSSTAAYTSCGD